MRFPPEVLEDIKGRLSVSSVVGGKVALKRAGREFKGLSPFNKEKTPSFYVNDAKGWWFDFSSGRNGSIFDFLMATEGCSFPEAVERLAKLAGVELPAASPEAEEASRRRGVLRDLHEEAARFFEKRLAISTEATEYARARGLLEIAPEIRLGYAPSDNSLKAHLTAAGADLEDLMEAGLVATDDAGRMRDRFRGRLMFPIMDLRGRVVAFGGRAISKDQTPKYLNSSETPLFHKGAMLYGGNVARPATYAGARLIVGEGYLDALAFWRIGHKAAVATLGTAVTADHLLEMWKWTDEPIFCLDGDEAGARAASKVADLALPMAAPGKSVRFITLPAGKDPDDILREGGPEALRKVLTVTESLVDFVWRRETEGREIDTPEAAAGLEVRLRELVGSIADARVRKHYGTHIAKCLREHFRGRPVPGWVPTAERSRFGRLSWRSQEEPGPEYQWVIKGVIPENETVMVSGPSGSGKSFETFNMGMHVACGWTYRGHRVPTPGLVIYAAPEGGRGFRDRMRAYRTAHGLPLDDIPMEVLTRRFNIFASDVDVEGLIREVKAIRDEWEAANVPLRMIVIDTWSAATGGMKENQSEDVAIVRARIKMIEQECGCGVTFVHHMNASGERERGHTSIGADIETVLRVTRLTTGKDIPKRDENGREVRRVSVFKQREGRDGAHWDFVIKSVKVRVDADGDDVESCVTEQPTYSNAEPDETPRPSNAKRPGGVMLNERQVMYFRALLRAMTEASQPAPATFPNSITRVVKYADLAIAFGRLMPNSDTTPDGREKYRSRVRSAMRYAGDRLRDLGAIGFDVVGEGDSQYHIVWPTGMRVQGPNFLWPQGPVAVDPTAGPQPEDDDLPF